MRYRKDIHDFLKKESPRAFTLPGYIRDGRPYEQDGDLYCARFSDQGEIEYYTRYEPTDYECRSLSEKIKECFGVGVSPHDEIVCRCGDKNSFSAHYGGYCLMLRCQCGNEFSAYSG